MLRWARKGGFSPRLCRAKSLLPCAIGAETSLRGRPGDNGAVTAPKAFAGLACWSAEVQNSPFWISSREMMVWQTRVNTTDCLHCSIVASCSGRMTLSATSSPDFLKNRISHFISFPEPASPPLPQAVLHQSNAFPAPGRVLDGSQIILLLFYWALFNVWPAELQGKNIFWSKFTFL